MKNEFLDIKIGDKVAVIDKYSRNYIVHTLKVTSRKEDPEFVTQSNPSGIHFYGDDMDYFNEADDDEFDSVTQVIEGNFIKIISTDGHNEVA